MSHSSLSIANEFLKRAQAEGRVLTNMHVQKLVYIAHGWNLAVNNEPLIDEPFQAWDFGPVAPELYQAMKRYGSGPITRLLRYGDETPYDFSDAGETATSSLLAPERDVIDQVWNDFKSYEAFQLSALTHEKRSPWFDVYYSRGRSAPIANNKIQEYFQELADPVE